MPIPKGHKPRPAQEYLNAMVDVFENQIPVGEVERTYSIASSQLYGRRDSLKRGLPAEQFFGRSEFNERQRAQYEALCAKFGRSVQHEPAPAAPGPAPAPVHQPVYVENTEATQKKIRRLEQTIEMLWDRIDALENRN